MPTTPQTADLSTILPGVWNVRSTNFAIWLTRERTSPRYSFELVSDNPLVLRDDVSHFAMDNQEKHVVGTDKWVDDHFVRRGKGFAAFTRARWTVTGTNDDHSVVAIKFEKTRFSVAGINVMVREGVEIGELRSVVARNTEQFGLTPEDFASLTWLD